MSKYFHFSHLFIKEVELGAKFIKITNVRGESRKPPVSNISSVPGLIEQSIKEITLETSKAIMEVEILI